MAKTRKFLQVWILLVTCVNMIICPINAAGIREQPVLMVLGDSISTGYRLGGEHYSEECYVQILGAANGFRVINKAVDGNTATDILNQIGDGSLDREIADADIITITCGGNDMLDFLYNNAAKLFGEISGEINGILNVNMDISVDFPADENQTDAGMDAGEYEQGAEPESDILTEIITAIPVNYLYDVFGKFVTGINNSLEYVKNRNSEVSIWERMAFLIYETAIEHTLDSAEEMLIDFTESAEYKTALEEFTEHLLGITAHIRGINPDVTIIVTTQYNPYYRFNTPACAVINNFIDAGVKKLNAEIMDNASEDSYITADVYSAFRAASENLCNAAESPLELDVHPNAEGHAVIADCIQAVLDELSVSEAAITDKIKNDVRIRIHFRR